VRVGVGEQAGPISSGAPPPTRGRLGPRRRPRRAAVPAASRGPPAPAIAAAAGSIAMAGGPQRDPAPRGAQRGGSGGCERVTGSRPPRLPVGPREYLCRGPACCFHSTLPLRSLHHPPPSAHPHPPPARCAPPPSSSPSRRSSPAPVRPRRPTAPPPTPNPAAAPLRLNRATRWRATAQRRGPARAAGGPGARWGTRPRASR
jgi:hypothetical protein